VQLAVTIWGYHPDLWFSCTSEAERTYWLRRASRILKEAHGYKPHRSKARKR